MTSNYDPTGPREPRRIDVTPKPAHPNAALREIAGRLQRLSYQEMMTLVGIMNADFPADDRDITGNHVLKVAAQLAEI